MVFSLMCLSFPWSQPKLQLVHASESLFLTSFVPHALAARAEVKGLPYSQLPQVDVSLIHVSRCAAWHEFFEVFAIVGDVAINLQGGQCCPGSEHSCAMTLHAEASASQLSPSGLSQSVCQTVLAAGWTCRRQEDQGAASCALQACNERLDRSQDSRHLSGRGSPDCQICRRTFSTG